MRKFYKAVMIVVLLIGLTPGCSTLNHQANDADQAAHDKATEIRDPFEKFNRAMYTFNEKADKYVLKPVARGYRFITPKFFRKVMANFFNNLREPIVLVNNMLQGKFKDGISDTMRLIVNSTFGLLGTIDVATPMGMPKHDEDFGQTLAVWGMGNGPYLVIPLLGPSTFRDASGLVVDVAMYPPTYIDETSTRSKVYAVNIIVLREQLLDATDILEQAGGHDPYVFVREFYRQRRRDQVYDGNPPVDKSIEQLLFEDEPSGP